MQALPLLLVLPALAFPASAQAPDLAQHGGAVPGTTTLTLDAGPAATGQLYGIVVAASEAPTLVLPGVTLDLPLDLLHLTFQVPGLFGTLDGAGQRQVAVALAAPGLVGKAFSSQALVGPAFAAPSNLLRTTLAAAGTFSGFEDGPPKRRIDYVLTTPDLEIVSASVDLFRYRGRWPSHHCPVRATIMLPD